MFKKTFLAVDIGNKNIKVVWGYYSKPQIYILEYDIVNTPGNIINDGRILSLEYIMKTLSGIIKKNKIKANKLIMNISGTGVITREIQLPKSTDDELESILKYDAQQYFPVDLEDYVMDFKILDDGASNNENTCRVLLVAVPLKQANDYMYIAEKLKIEMEAIDIPANSITKLVYGNASSEKTKFEEAAILDFGADTTGVYIFQDSKLMFNRILLSGSREIDKSLAKDQEIDISNAETLKIKKAKIFNDEDEIGETEDSIQICNAIRPAINSLMIDITRLIDFYASRSTYSKIQKIYMCGGGSMLAGLGKYVESYFNVPVEFLNNVANIEYKGKKSTEIFSKDYILLTNAIGALVRDSK
ncbi:MAG: type IV pilus assembly protein PilM [Bacillota bacterium]|nr:type IV pilus assembly protein PilM [Bacillota bacterium]